MSENRNEEMDAARAQIAAATREQIAATTREQLRTRRGTVPDHIRQMLEEGEGARGADHRAGRWYIAGVAVALAAGGAAWFLGLVPLP